MYLIKCKQLNRTALGQGGVEALSLDTKSSSPARVKSARGKYTLMVHLHVLIKCSGSIPQRIHLLLATEATPSGPDPLLSVAKIPHCWPTVLVHVHKCKVEQHPHFYTPGYSLVRTDIRTLIGDAHLVRPPHYVRPFSCILIGVDSGRVHKLSRNPDPAMIRLSL